MEIGIRPTDLDGCWRSWTEQDVDVVLRTEMDSGAVHTRRRFTGHARVVKATVTLPAELYTSFVFWFRIAQKQGSIPTWVKTPYGTEEIFQFTKPPTFAWPDPKAFTATVEMWQASYFA